VELSDQEGSISKLTIRTLVGFDTERATRNGTGYIKQPSPPLRPLRTAPPSIKEKERDEVKGVSRLLCSDRGGYKQPVWGQTKERRTLVFMTCTTHFSALARSHPPSTPVHWLVSPGKTRTNFAFGEIRSYAFHPSVLVVVSSFQRQNIILSLLPPPVLLSCPA